MVISDGIFTVMSISDGINNNNYSDANNYFTDGY